MRPMRPMAPMRPMEPLNFERWWPDDYGHPSSSGGQNGVRYAFFPEARRLLIERDGRRTAFDTGDHRIDSVSSQGQGGGEPSLTFSSQHGPVRLEDLRQVDEAGNGEPDGTPRHGAAAEAPGEPRSGHGGGPAPRPRERMEDAKRPLGQDGSERVVFSEEGANRSGIKLVVQGEIDIDMIEALEDYLGRQKRRLGRG